MLLDEIKLCSSFSGALFRINVTLRTEVSFCGTGERSVLKRQVYARRILSAML
jgi:hypothetical protein